MDLISGIIGIRIHRANATAYKNTNSNFGIAISQVLKSGMIVVHALTRDLQALLCIGRAPETLGVARAALCKRLNNNISCLDLVSNKQ